MDTVKKTSSKLVLYSSWLSSCSWRVRFTLNLKGLSYECRTVNLSIGEQFSPEFEKLNPLGYVPVLVDGDVVVSDSFAILLYLEETYPQKPLLPADPQLRAVSLQAASIISSTIQPLQMLVLKYIDQKIGSEERSIWAKMNIERGFVVTCPSPITIADACAALEKLLKNFGGRYAIGEVVTMVDVFLIPQFATAVTRLGMDTSKFPTLGAVYESCKELPEFQASSPERQPDAVH